MDPKIQLFLFFLAGITLAFAATSLVIGLQKEGGKAYLYLGLIGVCVGIYYLLFPLAAGSPSGMGITKAGLFFFLANFALLPWFLCAYTGYCKTRIQWGLSLGMALTYFLLLLTREPFDNMTWNIFGHLVLAGIIVFGFRSAKFQNDQGDRKSALLLAAALSILLILTVDDVYRIYFGSYYPINVPEDFLPLDYFLVFFMVVMGLKLARDMQQKFYLEKTINRQERQWVNLLKRVELLIVGLDPDGTVNFVNPYFLSLTSYKPEEVVGKNWFDHLLPDRIKGRIKDIFYSSLKSDPLNTYRNEIVTKDGTEVVVSWSNVIIEDDHGNIKSTLSIGSDITDQEKAFIEIEELKKQLEVENVQLKSELGKLPDAGKIIGGSDAIRYVLHRALQVARTDSTVLLEGETGVGKELIANYIQQNSVRAMKPYIKINCAAIPSTLLESELFGHLRGSFTGADRAKKGLVEMADQGTLLLDEIGDFPMDLQPKLLRFLQEGEFVPLGSEVAKKVNVRIIAATNKELLKEIEKGNFRNDLYYRLYVYPITIPTLGSRREDIPELVRLFVERYAKKHRKQITKVSKTVLEALKKYPWPGNIRELENVMERAVIVCTTDTIKLRDLSPVIETGNGLKKSVTQKVWKLEETEKNHIIRALEHTQWQVHGPDGAAELLGINPSTLRSRMKKLDISRPM